MRHLRPGERIPISTNRIVEPNGGAASRLLAYRTQIRQTLQSMSDQALRFQATVIRGGIDREELIREMNRRGM